MARVVSNGKQTEEVPETVIDESEEPEPGGLIGKFQCYVKSFGGTMYDELAITIHVPKTDKYKAMPMTDNRGFVYDVVVRRPPKRRGPGKKTDAFEFSDD